MKRFLLADIEQAFAGFPYGTQDEAMNPIVRFKLTDPLKGICWWLTEYDADSGIAMAYVTGWIHDEWGTVDLKELEVMSAVYGLHPQMDETFTPCPISECVPALGFLAHK